MNISSGLSVLLSTKKFCHSSNVSLVKGVFNDASLLRIWFSISEINFSLTPRSLDIFFFHHNL